MKKAERKLKKAQKREAEKMKRHFESHRLLDSRRLNQAINRAEKLIRKYDDAEPPRQP